MSRVGKMPIVIPAGVTVEVKGRTVNVKGPKGALSLAIAAQTDVSVKGSEVIVTRQSETKECRMLHGTMRSLIANMVEGVKDGFKKELEISGVGFKAQMKGNQVTMALGFSHPIVFDVPEGVTVKTPDATSLVIEGCDKQLVGLVGSRLRSYYPAEPYKGKGVKYKGEKIRRKAGKTVA